MINEEEVPSLVSPQKRVLLLFEKAREVVRFASAKECDSVFVELATFTERALTAKRKLREEATALSITDIVNMKRQTIAPPSDSPFVQRPCSPFGVCDASVTNDSLCECCDDGTVMSNNNAPDSVEACALCLCLLQHGGSLGLCSDYNL